MGDVVNNDSRIERLEERFTRTEDKVAMLDKNVAVYSAIFERTLQVHEKLSLAIDRLSETTAGLEKILVGVLQDIKRNAEAQEKNELHINKIESVTDRKIEELDSKLHKKLESLDGKLNTVDEKGKFDILKFIKDNFTSIVLAIYVGVDYVVGYLKTK
jgi:hypothetical protein